MVKNPDSYSNPGWSKSWKKGIPVLTEVEFGLSDFRMRHYWDYRSNGKTTILSNQDRGSLDGCRPRWFIVWKYRFSPASRLHKQRPKRMPWSWNWSLSTDGIEAFHSEIAVVTNLMPTHIDIMYFVKCSCQWIFKKEYDRKDVIVLNFNQDLAKELQSLGKGPSIFNGREGGRCLFGRWTSQV